MSNLLNRPGQKIVLLLVDLCLIFSSYVLAFFLRFKEIPQRNWDSFLSLAPWILLIGLFFLSVYELYSINKKSVWDIISSILVSVTFIMFLTMAASFLFREFALPRTIIFVASLLMIFLLTFWKIFFMKFSKREDIGKLLIIGDDLETKKLITQIKHTLLKEANEVKRAHPSISFENLQDYINNVDCVMICSNITKDKKTKICYQAMKNGKFVYVIPSLYDLLLSKSIITSLDDTMVMAVKPFGLTWDQQFIKRFFDVIVSLLLLIILSPLFLLVAVLIKFEDAKGTIFYKQKRIGKNNREFIIYKFRSMIEGAENLTGPVLAKENDRRITRLGRILRLTRIDELPQLYNVLKGDMSLVGPRPEREFFIQQFMKQHQSYQYRNTVKPGITGYAQIMGKYTTDVQDKLRYDLYYIRNYSFWLDIVILLRTLLVLLNKTKAEGKSNLLQTEENNSNNITFGL